MAPPATAVRIIPDGQLVYGLQLPITAQSTVFAAPWEATAGPAEVLAYMPAIAWRSGTGMVVWNELASR